jgi:hypothetical protein
MNAENKIGNPGHYFIQPFADQKIMEPPSHLDNAKVIEWAWSANEPFGYTDNKHDTNRGVIYGLAICKYEDSESVYCFSCDRNWKVVQTSFYDTVDNAIKQLTEQYKNVIANWYTK